MNGTLLSSTRARSVDTQPTSYRMIDGLDTYLDLLFAQTIVVSSASLRVCLAGR